MILCLLLMFTGTAKSHGQPGIALSDTACNFGHVAIGDTASRAFKIYNVGTDTLVVDSAAITFQAFEVTSPTFPETVVVDDSIEVAVWFIPSSTDSVSDSLTIFANDPVDSVVYVLLSGTGVTPDIALSDTSHDFGSVLVGDSADWILTMYNHGTDTLTVDSVVTDPDQFEISLQTLPDTIPPSDSLDVGVWFFPSDTGAVAGSLLVFSNDLDQETLAVFLIGTGVLQDIALSDSAHDFGQVLLGDSLDWVLTVYNEGTADLSVDSILPTQPEFVMPSLPFPDTLSAGDSIFATITFFPSDTGAMAGSLLVFSNDPDEETLSVSLMGHGVIPDIAVSDTSHDYGDVVVGDSLDWLLTIYNEGSGILTVDSVLLAPTEFEIICTTFPDTIPASDSLEVNIRFTPLNWGTVVGSLLVFSNDPDVETLSVALTGNGLAPEIAVGDSTLIFGNVLLGDSAEGDLQVYNLGNADLVIDSIGSTHDNFLTVFSSPETLVSSDTVDVSVFFVPSDTGVVTGSLMIFSNDPDEETLFVALAGTGIAPDIAVSDTSHDFGDVLLGDSLEWKMTIFNIGTADLIIDSILSMSDEFALLIPTLPETLSVADSIAITVTFIPVHTGVVADSLVIYSSDPDEEILPVSLSGRGVIPDISIVPDSLQTTIWEGGAISASMTLLNEGTGILIFQLSDSAQWLSENPDSGSINPGGSLSVEITFDASLLTIGEYDDTILVASNDPDEPLVSVPVKLTVREAQVILSIPETWSLPGDTVTIPLDMDNQTEREDPVAAFQSHLTFVDSFITVLDVTPTPRIDGLFDWSNPQPGRLIIVFATSELEAIEPGAGPVANITFQVSPHTMVGDSSLIHFEKVILSDTPGFAIPVRTEDGTIFLGTGLKGDVNMDGEVNILDAVWTINYILERIEFTPFQFWAANCNEDGEVNILDVVGIINVILGIGTCPPTSTTKVAIPSAHMWIEKEDIEQNGKNMLLPISIDNEIECAGIQLRLGYQAAKLIPGTPQLTERGAEMMMESKAKNGEIIILVYSINGSVIPSGTGPILTVPFQMADTRYQMLDCSLEFTEVILAGEGCQAIAVEIEPIVIKMVPLPTEYSMAQNYPNPFNSTTTIHYTIPSSEHRAKSGGIAVDSELNALHTTLIIYNLLGQEIRTLVNEEKEPGYYIVTWDGREENGKDVTSGVYFYRLSSGRFSATKKMVLIK